MLSSEKYNAHHFNPFTANDELSCHENLTFLWTWILRWVPKSFATHASLCNTLSSNKLRPKTVKILALIHVAFQTKTSILKKFLNKTKFLWLNTETLVNTGIKVTDVKPVLPVNYFFIRYHYLEWLDTPLQWCMMLYDELTSRAALDTLLHKYKRKNNKSIIYSL